MSIGARMMAGVTALQAAGGGLEAEVPAPPGAISDLMAMQMGDGIHLMWTPASDATSHEYRIDGGTPVATSAADEQHVEGDLLTPATEYDFEVRGVNAEGNGPWSNVATETTAGEEELPAATAPVLTQTSDEGANPLAWDTEFTDLIVDVDEITMRWRVDAGSWTDETNVSVDSAFYYDHILDGEPLVWPLYAAAVFSGGDVVDVQVGVLREGVTVWSNTLSDTIAVSDATFAYGGKATSASSSTVVNFTGVTFGSPGRALIFLTGYSNLGGTTDSTAPSLTLTPTGGGSGINCTLLGSGGRSASRAFAIYQSDSDVAAASYVLTGTRPSAARSNVLMYGTHTGDATPASGPTFTSGSGTNPHATASLTCPANGLIIGALMLETSVTVAANSGTAIHDQTFFNSELGLALGSRDTTGSISVNSTPNGNYNWGKGVLAFGPQ